MIEGYKKLHVGRRVAEPTVGSVVTAFAGLLFAPRVAPCQHVSEGPGGDPVQKKMLKEAFEAGMFMKTKETKTKCPTKSRTFTSI